MHTPSPLTPIRRVPRSRLLASLVAVPVILTLLISGGTAAASEATGASTPASATSMVSADFFTMSARGDLKDLYKDLNDMNDAINDGSIWRLLSNDMELAFNIGQLSALEPPSRIASEWQGQFGLLEKAVDAIGTAISDDASIGTLKSRVKAAKRQTLVVYHLVNGRG
jgi:hypothetical protein